MPIILKILNNKIGPGLAYGINSKGLKLMVIGGDLCYGHEALVNAHVEGSFTVYKLSKIDYPDISIFSEYFDNDGLIPLRDLKEVSGYSKANRRIYELDGFWVFGEQKLISILEFLYHNELSHFARIKISKSWAVAKSRASIYSVNFQSIFKKIIKERKSISSWYYCEAALRDYSKGVFADFYIKAKVRKGAFIIEMWQFIGPDPEVLYAHGIINPEDNTFIHFDLATHVYYKDEVKNMIENKKRPTLELKQKWLLLEGKFEAELIFQLLKLFFPYDSLIDEFFNKEIQ